MREYKGTRYVFNNVTVKGATETDLHIKLRSGEMFFVPFDWIQEDSKVKLQGQKGKLIFIVPEGQIMTLPEK